MAKFGLGPSMTRTAGVLGTFLVVVGLVVTVVGFVQHRVVIGQVGPAPDGLGAMGVMHVVAAVGSVLVCALLAIYLAANIK